MTSAILEPVVALAVWTMIVWIWMYATRIPAMNRAGIDGVNMVGSTGGGLRSDLTAKGEVKASWVADNYNHLHEAPTVFYAISIVLAIIGQGDGLNATIAWAYVGLRVAHSLVQILVNRVVVRFLLCVVYFGADDAGDTCRDGSLAALSQADRLKWPTSSIWVDQRNCPTGQIRCNPYPADTKVLASRAKLAGLQLT